MTLTITPGDITNAETRTIHRCLAGDAVITPSFGLQTDYIIHAVGPIWAERKGHNFATPLTDREPKQVEELAAKQIRENKSGDVDVTLIANPGLQIKVLRNK